MKRNAAKNKPQPKAVKVLVKKHIASLGLQGQQQYFEWCMNHKFKVTLEKSRADLESEYRAFESEGQALHQQARVHHNPEQFIRDVANDVIDASIITRNTWRTVGVAIAKTPQNQREHLSTFLLTVNKKSKFVFESFKSQDREYAYINTLIHFFDCRRLWTNDISSWTPRTKNVHRQFRSLLNHLFCVYSVPEFMELAWFRDDKVSSSYREWYLHLTAGKNIRTAKLPIPFTKKMAHSFLEAPKSYPIEHALIWAQIHALGGDKRLTEAVIEARHANTLKRNTFWVSVYRFFIDNPMMDRSHFGPVVDFIHEQKFAIRECVTAPGVVEKILPPQPNLSMTGRTPESLLKQVERWHGNLSKSVDARKFFFRKSGIPEFRQKTGEEKRDEWRIRELLSGADLIKEGRDMKHCVASYTRACVAGRCSIWTLEYSEHDGKIRKHQTIEINEIRAVVQMRGKQNRLPKSSELNLVRKWSLSAGLKISPYVVSKD